MSTQDGADPSNLPVSGSAATTWRRSSRCDLNGSCVEVAELADGMIGVRDGKIGAASPVLSFSGEQWRAFVSGIAAGHFDVVG